MYRHGNIEWEHYISMNFYYDYIIHLIDNRVKLIHNIREKYGNYTRELSELFKKIAESY